MIQNVTADCNIDPSQFKDLSAINFRINKQMNDEL